MRPINSKDFGAYPSVTCRECFSWYFHKDDCSIGRNKVVDWKAIGEALNTLSDEVVRLSREKGWLDDPSHFRPDGRPTDMFLATQVALCHTELSEALDEARYGRRDTWHGEGGKPEGFGVEMIDTIIRCLLLARLDGHDVGETLREKHTFNMTRPIRHGGKGF